jgi:CHASE2 domain-containing sensor protein
VAVRALVFLLTVAAALVLYAVLVRPLPVTHFLWQPERASQDMLVRLRPKPPVHPGVIEVAVNNDVRKLVNAEGEPLEGRSLYADLIRRLSADGAKVIVLDTYLPNRTTQAEDEALWRAMADTGKVYLPIKYDAAGSNVLSEADLRNLHELEYSVLHGSRSTVVPDAELESYTWWKFQPPVWDFTRNAGGGRAVGIGMAAYQPDPDGIVRTLQYGYVTNLNYPAGLPPSELQKKWAVANVIVPSQILPPALRMFSVDKTAVNVTLGRNITIAGDLDPRVIIPGDEWARAPISFVGPPGTIRVVNAASVLDGKAPKGTFTDKLVVLGVMGDFARADNLKTPMSASHPRMDVTAQGINSILTRKPLVRVTHMAFIPLVLLAIVAGLVIPAPYKMSRVLLAAIVVLVAYLVIAVVMAGAGLLLPLLSGVLVVLIAWFLTMALTVAFPT